MTENKLFNLTILQNNLRFMYPDFKWLLYSDHVWSNYRNMDIKISVYRPEGSDHSMFLVNYMDKYFKINDREVKLLNFDQLCKQIQSFMNMTKNEQTLLDLRNGVTW